mmetsp:Transcript_19255/g.27081  ORF Transcript_19255/g.27081 Transcript_19255/m.27081 type:complete len:171 (-) Transcript_19255:283-795(-)
MTILFPPLDGESESSEKSDMLSPELRESFETLHSLLRAQGRIDQDKQACCETFDNSVTNHKNSGKRKVFHDQNACVSLDSIEKDELERLKFEAALVTAVTAEEEISHLTNGIAELEELLNSEDKDPNSTRIDFPPLPISIPHDTSSESKNNACTFAVCSNSKINNVCESD